MSEFSGTCSHDFSCTIDPHRDRPLLSYPHILVGVSRQGPRYVSDIWWMMKESNHSPTAPVISWLPFYRRLWGTSSIGHHRWNRTTTHSFNLQLSKCQRIRPLDFPILLQCGHFTILNPFLI